MTDREKLVELLKTSPTRNGYTDIEDIADHLSAHGVTVQHWVSAGEILPKADTIILVFVRGYVDVGWYDGNHDEWRTGIVTLDNSEITHWMPLPEPPKEG